MGGCEKISWIEVSVALVRCGSFRVRKRRRRGAQLVGFWSKSRRGPTVGARHIFMRIVLFCCALATMPPRPSGSSGVPRLYCTSDSHALINAVNDGTAPPQDGAPAIRWRDALGTIGNYAGDVGAVYRMLVPSQDASAVHRQDASVVTGC